MKDLKHTPGEWKATANRYYHEVACRNITRTFNATVHLYDADSESLSLSEEAKANAKLIAAAPELLTALTELLSACETADANEDLPEVIDGGLLDRANKVIKKATEL